MIEPQFDSLKSNKVSSLIKDSLNTTFESQHSFQGALALTKDVANNPMLQLEKSSGSAQSRYSLMKGGEPNVWYLSNCPNL